MNEANLSVIKIEAIHCYCCGNQFQPDGKHKKTMHHAIPQFHKPHRNVLVPVCEDCHRNITKFTVQSVPKLEALDNFIRGIETFLVKYKKVMARSGMKERESEE